MEEHPMLRMWKERLEAEVAEQKAWTARLAVRQAQRTEWDEAWRRYKDSTDAWRNPTTLPRWWNLIGWILWLLRLHAPGRPN